MFWYTSAPAQFTASATELPIPPDTECLGLSKALQRVAETFQVIADLHDDHVRPLCVIAQISKRA